MHKILEFSRANVVQIVHATLLGLLGGKIGAGCFPNVAEFSIQKRWKFAFEISSAI
jgi:hypothetical protein